MRVVCLSAHTHNTHNRMDPAVAMGFLLYKTKLEKQKYYVHILNG